MSPPADPASARTPPPQAPDRAGPAADGVPTLLLADLLPAASNSSARAHQPFRQSFPPAARITGRLVALDPLTHLALLAMDPPVIPGAAASARAGEAPAPSTGLLPIDTTLVHTVMAFPLGTMLQVAGDLACADESGGAWLIPDTLVREAKRSVASVPVHLPWRVHARIVRSVEGIDLALHEQTTLVVRRHLEQLRAWRAGRIGSAS